jgi:hypothetical protein
MQGAWSKEQGARSMEQGAWSKEQGARSMERGARGMEQGAWRGRAPLAVLQSISPSVLSASADKQSFNYDN